MTVRLTGRRWGLRRDERGATLIEFALLIPVMALMLMGFMDVGHTLYVQSVLQGEVQKTARDSGLETGTAAERQAIVDGRVRRQVLSLNRDAAVAITRRTYRSFSKAAAAQAEPFTDSNGNTRCDNGEPYEDQNGNAVRDLDGGNEGQGGAKDTVVYTVTMTYPRMFPIDKLANLAPTTNVKATTVMNNQPYGDQGSDTPTVRQCPLV